MVISLGNQLLKATRNYSIKGVSLKSFRIFVGKSHPIPQSGFIYCHLAFVKYLRWQVTQP